MKQWIIAVAVLCSAGSVLAIEHTTAVSYTDQTNVIERFRYLERVDVTAEKPIAEQALREELSTELEALLDEVTDLELGDD